MQAKGRAPPPSPLAGAGPGQPCIVFPLASLRAVEGVNAGEVLGLPDTLCAGDHYRLKPQAQPLDLRLAAGDGGQRVQRGAGPIPAGAPVQLLARYILLDAQADQTELLVLQIGAGHYILPRAPMQPGADYVLVEIGAAPKDLTLGAALSLSFLRGTLITCADGRQAPVESLKPGDLIFTRDNGPQALRWLGHARLKAIGPSAPVVVTAGTLGNSGDLVVGPQQRLFLYQRNRLPGMDSPAVLIQARHLVDGTRVFRREGGAVDYYALIFDHHEIIFAEGLAVESLLVTPARRAHLPPALAAELAAHFPGLAQTPHFGAEFRPGPPPPG